MAKRREPIMSPNYEARYRKASDLWPTDPGYVVLLCSTHGTGHWSYLEHVRDRRAAERACRAYNRYENFSPRARAAASGGGD